MARDEFVGGEVRASHNRGGILFVLFESRCDVTARGSLQRIFARRNAGKLEVAAVVGHDFNSLGASARAAEGDVARSATGRLPPRPVAPGEQTHLHSPWL